MNLNVTICCLAILGLVPWCAAQGRVVVDPGVSLSAQAAVQKLGQEMMKGNFEYGQEKMYPRWKRRLAKRYGGMEKLDAALEASAQQKIKMRIAVVAFQAAKPTSFFSVWRTPKYHPVTKKPLTDASGKKIIVEHWLAIVPTTTRVRVPDPRQGGKMLTLEERSHTFAVSEKGSNQWHFMTGLKPTIQDLRSLFPTLPPKKEELGLPPSSARQIK